MGDAREALQPRTLAQDWATQDAAVVDVQESCRGNWDDWAMQDGVSGRVFQSQRRNRAAVQEGFSCGTPASPGQSSEVTGGRNVDTSFVAAVVAGRHDPTSDQRDSTPTAGPEPTRAHCLPSTAAETATHPQVVRFPVRQSRYPPCCAQPEVFGQNRCDPSQVV